MTYEDVKAQYDAVNAAITATLTGGVKSVSVAGGMSYEKFSLKELMDLRKELAQTLYKMENSQDGSLVRVASTCFNNNQPVR